MLEIKAIKYNLPVEGMTCASCVARVEKSLNKIDGIENVSVNYASEKVAFELDENVSLETAKVAVEKYGYKLFTEVEETISTNEAELVDENHKKL